MANIAKIAAKTGTLTDIKNEKIPAAYQPDLIDMELLFKMALSSSTGLWEALDTVFRFGYVMGNHATLNRGLKRI